MAARDKLQVILLGTTGSGKSASGNTILDKKIFKSNASTQSVTVSFQSAMAIINGTEVIVVDTPGWHCTKISEDEVAAEIKRAILSLEGPYSFLMVIPIGSYTPKEMHMISKLYTILGENFMKHTTILFSKNDDLESKSFDQFLEEEEGPLKSLIISCGNRVHTWNNKDTSSVKDKDKLLQNLRTTQIMHPQLQNKMLDEKVTRKQDQDLMEHDDFTADTAVPKKSLKKENSDKLDETNGPIRVVVLGMSGVGKTSIIKTLCGKNLYTQSKNSPVYPINRMIKGTELNVNLIDSTGFKNVTEVENIISQSWSYATPGPHVIMIAIKVGRMTQETLQMTGYIHSCLENSVEHTMIVFTAKDELEYKTIEEFIEENPQLADLVQMHGSRFHALNNKDINDQNQVSQLLEKILIMHHENRGHVIKVEKASIPKKDKFWGRSK